MFGLTPFNRQAVQRSNNGFVDFYHVMDDFFNNDLLNLRDFKYDTFKVDIKEDANGYAIEAEMPGVKKEDIAIDYQNDQLIIAVQRKEEMNDEKDQYIHRERRIASMQRAISLKDVKVEGITAKLEEGILKINIPKEEVPTAKRLIEIQ